MKAFIFRVEVEVIPMSGTQLPDDAAGAFVNCYIGADNIREAIDLVEAQLLEDCYKPFQTYAAFSLDLDEVDYDTLEDGLPDNEDLLKLQSTGAIWYGPFNTYLPEMDDVH
ncbi:hypothetical protein [Marinicellulosiphila megalodicopiae]|uniref:hypothetical protein n=1 Tax=Marinicellulosiphila megalodicopiae TaxID=2724896 RepID=UPI003BB2236B